MTARVSKPEIWTPGQHVVVCGDTGTGKTYLVEHLVRNHYFTCVFATKADDIHWSGFKRSRDWKIVENVNAHRVIVDPSLSNQQRAGYELMRAMWQQGGWTFVVDEHWYAENILKLQRGINMLLTQGRSKHLTVVLGMQRPVQVSRFALSQATHAFFFRLEPKDAKYVAEATTAKLFKAVQTINGHDFVYFNRATRRVIIGNADSLDSVIVSPDKLWLPWDSQTERAM